MPKDMVRQLRSEAVSWLLGGAIFLLSAAPVFGHVLVDRTLLRTDLWVAAMIIVWLRRYARKVMPEYR
ncbi:MAG: hypothetical protein LYZ69_05820 [Nitrososphaerales archaeon]|nr:hypothetical protein [Nitrososphaerales archaeon]